VTFRTERSATKILDEYLETSECRECKDIFTCCSEPFDSKFEYSLPDYKDGTIQRLKVLECNVEPGDINWENLGVVGCEKCTRYFYFLTIVILVSSISFAVMIKGHMTLASIPAPTNCASQFTSSFDGLTPAYDSQETVDQLDIND